MPPRIAHVISTPSGLGGAERVMGALVAAGAARGFDQVVLNPFANDAEHSELAALCAPAPYAGFPCGRLGRLPAARAWLGHRLADTAPAIVHVHLFHALVLVASLRQPRGARTVLTHHHTSYHSQEGRPAEEALDRWAGRRVERIVAISEWSRRFLLDRYRYPAAKVVLIRNGWAGRPLASDPPEAHPTVVCVANLRRQKGHEVLLAAWERVVAELPRARLVLVGDGPLGPELRAGATATGLADSVRFAGPTGSAWADLARAHVFALASHYEPLGIAVMEAMAAGLPVVATAAGGIPELVRPGLTGELVSPGDHRALADHLLGLLCDPPRRARMGAAARAAAEDHRMETTVQRYLDLYDGLVPSRQSLVG